MEVLGIWIGIGIATTGIAVGTKNGSAAAAAAAFMAFFGMIATSFIAG